MLGRSAKKMNLLYKYIILTIFISLNTEILAKELNPNVKKYEDEHIIISMPEKGKVAAIGPENAYIIYTDKGRSLTTLEITGDEEPIEFTKKRITQSYSLFEKSINDPVKRHKDIKTYKDLSEVKSQKTNRGNFLLFTVTSLQTVGDAEVQSYITFLFGNLDNKNLIINYTTVSKENTTEDIINLINKISCKK